MKKIMQFIHGMTMGGAETLVKDYLLNLNKKEYELVLLVMKKYNTLYEKILEAHGIKVIYIDKETKLSKKNNIVSRIINYIKRYITVKKVINIEEPDILHIHLPIESYVKFAKPKKPIKIFSTIHSAPQELYNNTYKRQKELKAAKWLVKNYNMRFIVLHNDMRKEINKMFNVDNSIILNNGIDFKRFENPKLKMDIRRELNIPENAFVVGHVGRFSKVKNHNFLIDVFNEINKKNENSFLLMIGNGREINCIENRLHKLQLDNKYLILKDRIDIPDLMNAMDVFIFPSTYEGLGIVLIEAQKMKLPCFKSDVVPNYAIISNLVTTLSLDDNPYIWADKVLNYKYPAKININEKEWDIKMVVQKLEKIYQDKI